VFITTVYLTDATVRKDVQQMKIWNKIPFIKKNTPAAPLEFMREEVVSNEFKI